MSKNTECPQCGQRLTSFGRAKCDPCLAIDRSIAADEAEMERLEAEAR